MPRFEFPGQNFDVQGGDFGNYELPDLTHLIEVQDGFYVPQITAETDTERADEEIDADLEEEKRKTLEQERESIVEAIPFGD